MVAVGTLLSFGIAMMLGCAATTAPPATAAQPEQDSAEADSFTADLQKLTSTQRSERVAAEKRLSEADPSLLEMLPTAKESGDAFSAAIVRIRKRLEDRRVLRDLAATKLDGESVKTLGELAPLIQGEVSAAQDALTFDLPDRPTPLWEMVDAAAGQNELWPVVSQRVTFRDRTEDDDLAALSYVGPFRIVVSPVHIKRIDVERQLARTSLEIQAEPKLRPLFLSCDVDQITLSDPRGTRLVPFTPQARYEVPFGAQGMSAQVAFDHVIENELVAGPFDLRGAVHVTAALGAERFDFPLSTATPAAVRSRGGVVVRLRKAILGDDGTARVELAVVYDEGGPAFESHRTWAYYNAAEITFAHSHGDDREIVHVPHEPAFATLSETDGGVVLAYQFSGIPEDAADLTFSYTAPTNIARVPVVFEIAKLKNQPRFLSGGSVGDP